MQQVSIRVVLYMAWRRRDFGGRHALYALAAMVWFPCGCFRCAEKESRSRLSRSGQLAIMGFWSLLWSVCYEPAAFCRLSTAGRPQTSRVLLCLVRFWCRCLLRLAARPSTFWTQVPTQARSLGPSPHTLHLRAPILSFPTHAISPVSAFGAPIVKGRPHSPPYKFPSLLSHQKLPYKSPIQISHTNNRRLHSVFIHTVSTSLSMTAHCKHKVTSRRTAIAPITFVWPHPIGPGRRTSRFRPRALNSTTARAVQASYRNQLARSPKVNINRDQAAIAHIRHRQRCFRTTSLHHTTTNRKHSTISTRFEVWSSWINFEL